MLVKNLVKYPLILFLTDVKISLAEEMEGRIAKINMVLKRIKPRFSLQEVKTQSHNS